MSQPESLTGQLLVASRKLRDPNFLRTVVLLLEHNDDGALGVVLNRLADRTISEVWDTIKAEPCDNPQPLNLGGPVPGPLIALHKDKALSEREVVPGLYMSMQREAVDQLVRDEDKPVRIYTGNAGWGGGQLEGELKVGGWLTTQGKEEDVFTEPDELWLKVTRRIGLEIVMPGVDPEAVPEDPTVN